MKDILFTQKAPAPIGPYSQAVSAGGMVFLSGQIAIDSSTNELNISDLDTEVNQIMHNIKMVLEAAGLELSDIVKTSIFLKNMDDFSKVNEIYAGYFKNNYPARETVEVSKLPKNVNVEISIIAIKS